MFSKKSLCFGSVSDFMILSLKTCDFGKKQEKGGLHLESVFNFCQHFCQNGQDKALKIRTYSKSSY